MLKLRDLALRSDFEVGPISVSPSRRRVRGLAGEVTLEPLIMQVFLLLLDADGRVVTRDELFDQCWGGVVVGDDSLNRAVAKVRRIGAEVAPGAFEIETIPRTGYRLTGPIVEGSPHSPPAEEQAVPGQPLSRRTVMVSAGATLAVLAAGGAWLVDRNLNRSRFDALMAKADQAFQDGSAFEQVETPAGLAMLGACEDAVRIRPDSARAWGLLAFFRTGQAEIAPPRSSAEMTTAADAAIRRALSIDPREPNALTAQFLLEGDMLDWASRDAHLRRIVAFAPDNIPALTELMALVQAAGLTRESWRLNEHVLQVAPLSRVHLVVRAMKLWILGRIADSDQVIDHVRTLWPLDDFAYQVRCMLFALTGRPQAAMGMLNSAPGLIGPPAGLQAWRASLKALESGTRPAIAAARDTCVEVARKEPGVVNMLVMLLGALGETEAAFDVANGFILWRGKVVSADQSNGKAVNDQSRKMTQWLFTPPLAALRADPRFLKLCEDFGLGAYWRARHVRPDYLVYG